MKRILLSIAVLFGFADAKAQTVDSKAFDLMLSGLLSHSVSELSVADLDTYEGAIYLDARAKEEFLVSKIPNAIWIGYEEFEPEMMAEIPKEQVLIVYCSVGYRSEKIAEQIRDLGYPNVHNLYGGIFEWMNQGKNVVNIADMPTDTVHAYSKSWGIWLKKGEKVYQHD